MKLSGKNPAKYFKTLHQEIQSNSVLVLSKGIDLQHSAPPKAQFQKDESS